MRWRLRMAVLRGVAFVTGYPLRLVRWMKWLLWMIQLNGRHRGFRWIAGFVMLTVDLTPIPWFIITLLDMIKVRSRPLNANEIATGQSIFGQLIPWRLISIDPASIPARHGRTNAYVLLHSVNFNQTIPTHVLIHELVHIWQYEKMGSVYITEALWAQKWGGGYDYGGEEKLRAYASTGLKAFNLEQQADIIEDYFRWKNGLKLQWAEHKDGIGELLEIYKSGLDKTLGN